METLRRRVCPPSMKHRTLTAIHYFMSRMTSELIMPAVKINWCCSHCQAPRYYGYNSITLFKKTITQQSLGRSDYQHNFSVPSLYSFLARAITKEKDYDRKIAESVVLLKDITLWIFRSFSFFQLQKENGRRGADTVLHPSKASLQAGQ